jgi:hypothetical protein
MSGVIGGIGCGVGGYGGSSGSTGLMEDSCQRDGSLVKQGEGRTDILG